MTALLCISVSPLQQWLRVGMQVSLLHPSRSPFMFWLVKCEHAATCASDCIALHGARMMWNH